MAFYLIVYISKLVNFCSNYAIQCSIYILDASALALFFECVLIFDLTLVTFAANF